ncbi:hypothetical protein FC693_18935 [Bacillus cereus]|nr:hypothetical protein FC693_18935 [Bacillus cereus]
MLSQTCLIHVVHNLSHKVRLEERQVVYANFKTVYKVACQKSS